MSAHQVGIEPQRQLQLRDGRAIFPVLEVSIPQVGMAGRGIRLQLSYYAELLNRHIQPTLLLRRRPGLCVLDDFRRGTLQKKTTGDERKSHHLPASESDRSSRPNSLTVKLYRFGVWLNRLSIGAASVACGRHAIAPRLTLHRRRRDSAYAPFRESAEPRHRLPTPPTRPKN